jgi:diaminopimelate decarboxylase
MKREPYEKPSIIKHQVGLMNKFGRLPATIPIDNIEGFPVKDLLKKFGSPLYVVSEKILRRTYREFFRAFSMRYPKVQIAFSYKTNYLGGVCLIFHQEGAWAEVVSGFEYEIARNLGIPGNKIVFNGPYKTVEELRRASEEGSMINIDHQDEIYLLEKISEEKEKPIEVGIRINMDVGVYPAWDRFGFNLESGQALEAAKRIVSGKKLKLIGLHCHIGTFVMDPEIYRVAAEKMVEFARILTEELEVHLRYIDMGGGFASRNTLHTMWLSGEQVIPSFDRYAEALTSPFFYGPFKPEEMPLLILEPGRILVDKGIYLITTVVGTKRLSDGRRAIIIDAGVNNLFTAFWFRHEVRPAQDSGVILEETNVYGPLCMQIDVIRERVPLPHLKMGDAVVIKNVGAYNLSQSMQFIRPRPAVILVGEGEPEILRERETTEYILQPERIPERLKLEKTS